MNRTGAVPSIELRRPTNSQLWLLSVLFFGIGDVATTSVGLGMAGVIESSPVAAPLIRQYGPASMIVLKLAAFGVCYGLWKLARRPYRGGVPFGLAILGVALTAWNLHVLVVASLG